MKVQPHCSVRLYYTMEAADDAPFPYPTGPFRMECLIGHGVLHPCLEEALLGKEEGETVEVLLPPGAFVADSRLESFVPLPVERIAEDGPHEEGAIRHVMDAQHRLQPFRVVKQNGGLVWADFRHPLADRSFRFQIRVEKVRWATLEEIKNAARHGAVH
ncbi:FKBP-type peptidyl-prolyl cis-trans isomerase [Desulfosoma sp.]|uniref:FKBP-type peptidyl-prolyl cis-trans isomerase n=1 Tax=Desulfosoma sp. TaxID=2603217 RepID=UPI00404B0B39